jgi:hypothetical protein
MVPDTLINRNNAITTHWLHGGGGGVDERACARKAALTCRERVAHTLGPSCAHAALRRAPRPRKPKPRRAGTALRRGTATAQAEAAPGRAGTALHRGYAESSLGGARTPRRGQGLRAGRRAARGGHVAAGTG